MAERPDTRQLTIDDCADLSRRISDVLDALEAEGRDPIEDAYRLEGQLAGHRPPADPAARISPTGQGHEARIRLAEPVDGRKQLTGDLDGVEGDTITDRRCASIGADDDRRSAASPDAKLLMTDRLIAATAPLSAEGADEIEELEDADAEGAHRGQH